MIGHNNGPPIGDINETGGRGRLYLWRKAHKAAWRTPPIEIVRLRDRAAQRLGLSYKDYTSILLDRGRRVSAVFFQLEGTLIRMRHNGAALDAHGAELMPGVRRKLLKLDCAVFVLGGVRGHLATAMIEQSMRQIGALCRNALVDYTVAAATAADGATDLAVPLRELLNRHQLPASQAVLVGDTVEAERAAATIGLARFLWAWHYFSDSLAQSSEMQ